MNYIISHPLRCVCCGVSQAERNGGQWNDTFHCYDCRKALIGREPRISPAGRELVFVLVFLDGETLVETFMELSQSAWETMPDEYGEEGANGLPTQFVKSDDLYWGTAAPGFR